jgi:aspartate racemase
MKIVGVIGGMGPEATVDLMDRVIRGTPAEDDADHIRLLVDSNPKVPSRIAALMDGTGEDPAPSLIDMAKGLERMGADFLVMPCNTAHHYHGQIAEAVDIPLVNLIDLTAEAAAAQQPRLRRAGLLASSAVRLVGLYDRAFQARGVATLFPGDARQAELMGLIRKVKSKAAGDVDMAALNATAEDLADAGAECLIVACTELSVVADRLETPLPVLDAAQVLADYIVREAR